MNRAGHDGTVDPTAGAIDRAVGGRVDPAARRREITMFLVLAFVIWPFIAVAVVGGYGFLVWMSQLVMGPPGPPVH